MSDATIDFDDALVRLGALHEDAAFRANVSLCMDVANDSLAARDAVVALLGQLQAVLEPLEGQELSTYLRNRVHYGQGLAVEALRRSSVTSTAVNFQRRKACGERPLTVCYGAALHEIKNRRLRKASRTGYYVHLAGDGCGRVVEWSTTRPEKVRCRECRDANTTTRSHATLEARAAAHMSGRFDYLYGRDDGTTFRAYVGLCSRCGEEFVDERPHVQTCELCRKVARAL